METPYIDLLRELEVRPQSQEFNTPDDLDGSPVPEAAPAVQDSTPTAPEDPTSNGQPPESSGTIPLLSPAGTATATSAW